MKNNDIWIKQLCYPGDSKSIKFLGVFGVDCFFSKSDAFLTKTPQTAKNYKIWFLGASAKHGLYLINKNAGNYPQNSRKKPQNSRKSRQTPANPEKS